MLFNHFSVLDDDDVELLDLIARTGGDLRNARPLTGSTAKDPGTQDYSLAGKIEDLIIRYLLHLCFLNFYILYFCKFYVPLSW